jgi:hypothetical protein
LGDEKYAQARFSAKRANGLAKPSHGLGLGSAPKSKPKPEKARLRGRKPVLQAENVTLIQSFVPHRLFSSVVRCSFLLTFLQTSRMFESHSWHYFSVFLEHRLNPL